MTAPHQPVQTGANGPVSLQPCDYKNPLQKIMYNPEKGTLLFRNYTNWNGENGDSFFPVLAAENNSVGFGFTPVHNSVHHGERLGFWYFK